MMVFPRIYPITDARIGGISHAEQIRCLAAGGATLIQLREKIAPPRQFFEAALEAVKIGHSLRAQIIINDRVDIALAVGADGVHLGQEDLPPECARKILGREKIIGFSVHNLEQALAADSMPVDYIAVGPIFETSTKERPDPIIGLDALRRIRNSTSKPIVAIGGITLERLREVFEAGADSAALISDILSASDIADRVRQLLEASRHHSRR
jgi:thiamine-phosphate pyrophosphorylase